MSKSHQPNDIIFYSTPTCNVKIEVIVDAETFWLTQKRMAAGVVNNYIATHKI